MEENIRNLLETNLLHLTTYHEFDFLPVRRETIPDRFAQEQPYGEGQWWDFASDYFGQRTAVSRTSAFDADYWMDRGLHVGNRRAPSRELGYDYQKTGVLNDYKHVLDQVVKMGRQGEWVTGRTVIQKRNRLHPLHAFASDVLEPLLMADWRGVSAILLDGMIHRLLNIQQPNRLQPIGTQTSRTSGVWELRGSAVRNELGYDISMAVSSPPLLTVYSGIGDILPKLHHSIQLFQVPVEFRHSPTESPNRWDYSVISDPVWRALLEIRRERQRGRDDPFHPGVYANQFRPPFDFAYYAPPPVALSVKVLYHLQEFQGLLANYQQPGIGSIIYDWLQDQGVPPEDAVPFLTPGHAALFPLML